MTILRRLLLGLLILWPLWALGYWDFQAGWQLNRSAFASPDEPSYLLMAEQLAAGHGIRLAAPLDTFYPPGFPALLALWGRFWGLGLPAMHLAVVLMGCVNVALVYALAQEMKTPRPLLVTALFATSYPVMENLASIFSEPAFIGITLVWLLLALRWRFWPRHLGQTLMLTMLAILATTIRSAGIVHLGVMLLYPWFQKLERGGRWKTALRACLVSGLLIGGYYGLLHRLSPEKSPFQARGNHSYLQQLLGNLGGSDLLTTLGQVLGLIGRHLDNWTESLLPPAWETPAAGLYNGVAKLLLLLALGGLLLRALRRRESRPVELFVLAYVGLYAVWPFDFVRFWIPILPLSLIYLDLGLEGKREALLRPRVRVLGATLLVLALVLNLREQFRHYPHYLRRINEVSARLAASRPALERAKLTGATIASLEPFTFYYYTRQKQWSMPWPEPVEEVAGVFLGRLQKESPLILADYFTRPWMDPLVGALLARGCPVRVIYRGDIVGMWRVDRPVKGGQKGEKSEKNEPLLLHGP